MRRSIDCRCHLGAIVEHCLVCFDLVRQGLVSSSTICQSEFAAAAKLVSAHHGLSPMPGCRRDRKEPSGCRCCSIRACGNKTVFAEGGTWPYESLSWLNRPASQGGGSVRTPGFAYGIASAATRISSGL